MKNKLILKALTIFYEETERLAIGHWASSKDRDTKILTKIPHKMKNIVINAVWMQMSKFKQDRERFM